MMIREAAPVAVLLRAVLDLAGGNAAGAEPWRAWQRRLPENVVNPAARAHALMGQPAPVWEQPHESIFSLIPSDSVTTPALLRPCSLTAEPHYPAAAITPVAQAAAAEELRRALQTDIATLARTLPDPTPEALLFLLEKYGWAVSAGAPGLSFAEVSRLAAASAGLLATGADQFCLVGADLSGIQSFIYKIGSKGALRGLRARSFLLELLAEDTLSRLLTAWRLTRANLLYAGGGHFYLLAPAGVDASSVQASCNDWLRSELGGSLFLSVGASQPFPPEALAPGAVGSTERWAEVGVALARQKSTRLQQDVTDPAFWAPWPVEPARCEICHREVEETRPLRPPTPDEEPVAVCPLCQKLDRLGQRLPGARYIVATKPDAQSDLVINGTGYRLCKDQTDLQALPDRQAVLLLNSLEAADHALPGAYVTWLGQYAARQTDAESGEERMATFEELAAASTGARLLGVLRMDVDRLGRLFRSGLPEETRDFPRLAALSRSLTQFFKLHLDQICAGHCGEGQTPLRLSDTTGPRPVTIVYAGGDDLFIVGAWDQLLELSFDIHSTFTQYTGGRLTISGGMVAEDVYRPLYHLADLAGDAEDAAKEERDGFAPLYAGRSPAKQARRKEPALRWQEAAELRDELLRPLLRLLRPSSPAGPRLSRRFLHKMLDLIDYWQQEGPLYLPRLAYLLASVDTKVQERPEWKAIRGYLMTKASFPKLTPILCWLDLLVRGGESDDRE